MSISLAKAGDIVTSYLEAVRRGSDSDLLDLFFDPNVEYVVNGSAESGSAEHVPPISADLQRALPWFGRHRGRDAVRGFLERMHANLRVSAYGPFEVISEGNKAAVFGWFELKATSGRSARIGFSVNVETRDGLIVKYHFLENTFDVAGAFRTAGNWTIETDRTAKSVPALSVERFAASEPGAWSNAYLLAGSSDALLFDAVMLRSDAEKLADLIVRSGKTLKTIFISHAHPDHFMALETLVDRFPHARVLATPDVVADVKADGPWILSLLQGKLGPAGPTRLVVPEPFTGKTLEIDGIQIEIREFGQGECKHLTTLYVPELRAFFAADLLYNHAHLYLQEKHLEDWLTRLDEFEAFARDRVSIIYPGHGAPGGLDLIEGTRSYLRTFAEALKLGDAKSVEAEILAAYPDHHVKQFLTVFTLPAYFPPASPAKA